MAIQALPSETTTIAPTSHVSYFDSVTRVTSNTAPLFIGNNQTWGDPEANKLFLRGAMGGTPVGSINLCLNGRYIHEVRMYTTPLSRSEMSVVHAEMRAFWS